jgi:hypothetical protein
MCFYTKFAFFSKKYIIKIVFTNEWLPKKWIKKQSKQCEQNQLLQ